MFEKTCFPFRGYSQLPATEIPVESKLVIGNKKLSKNGWRIVARW